MNGSPALQDILSPDLVLYTSKITFPWPIDDPLDGSEVGRIFFGNDYDATKDWSTAEVQDALLSLSRLDISRIQGADLIDTVLNASPPISSTFEAWTRIIGLVLLLDQGPRYLCKQGTNARYIYEKFDVLALRVVKALLAKNHPVLSLARWQTDCKVSEDQALLRVLMLLPPLVHSENVHDQDSHMYLTNIIRRFWEGHTGTRDPYRETFERDHEDIHLFGRILDAGPPQGEDVCIGDFFFWIMRYYTSHIAYVKHFGGRSPFRNVAVGRQDGPGEVAWLRTNHIEWNAQDETTREQVHSDAQKDAWTPLKFEVAN